MVVLNWSCERTVVSVRRPLPGSTSSGSGASENSARPEGVSNTRSRARCPMRKPCGWRARLVKAPKPPRTRPHAWRVGAEAAGEVLPTVFLRAAETGEDQRPLAVHDVAAVELGAHLHGQRTVSKRAECVWNVGSCEREVAGESDEHLDVAGVHRP